MAFELWFNVVIKKKTFRQSDTAHFALCLQPLFSVIRHHKIREQRLVLCKASIKFC